METCHDIHRQKAQVTSYTQERIGVIIRNGVVAIAKKNKKSALHNSSQVFQLDHFIVYYKMLLSFHPSYIIKSCHMQLFILLLFVIQNFFVGLEICPTEPF